MVMLPSVAAVIGLGGAGAAWVLLHLVALLTDVAVFGHVGFDPPSFARVHAGPRLVVVAVVGALVVSLFAKWSLRGLGIPEAMEAVLRDQSRIAPTTAVAKPLSSVVLAIELLLFEFSARALVPLAVSASVAAAIHAAIDGPGPQFTVPAHELSACGPSRRSCCWGSRAACWRWW